MSDKQKYDDLSEIAKNMGFGDIDFAKMAKNFPVGKQYDHLDLEYSDGTKERIYIDGKKKGLKHDK